MNLDYGCGARLHSSNFGTFLTMRFSQPPTLLSLLAIVLSSIHTTGATPLPQDETILGSDNSTLVERTCANPCGNGGLCCGVQQACLTVNGQPNCGDGAAAPATTANNVANNGQYQLYTTTYVETDLVTRTSTYSSYFASITSQVVATPTTYVAPAVTTLACNLALQESPCGTICCAGGQICQYQGQCGAAVNTVGDVSSFAYSSVTNTASAFIRPTSNTVQTVTSTGAPTTTVPFSTPTSTSSTAGMAASTTNNGLSGGAIAGIVIGVIAGILLLLLICTFFCFKGLLDGFLALIGLGPKRRRTEETYIEERHSRHTGGGGGGGRTWYGAARPNRVDRPKKSGLGGVTGVAAGLTALAVILGLKRRRDRREKSEYTGSSYSYSDYTSASE